MSELLGIARFRFHEGKRAEYLRLSDQALEIVRTKDSGTLGYDLYLNGDRSECMVIERYRDSVAAIQHASNVGHLFSPVLAAVSVVHGELLGEPSAELRANHAGSDVPVLFTPYRSWGRNLSLALRHRVRARSDLYPRPAPVVAAAARATQLA